MIINNNKDLIYNINCLICIPKEYERKAEIYEYNFKYVYILETNYKETNSFINFVNSNNIDEIILLDYRIEYDMIIEKLGDEIPISMLISFDLASLTDEYYRIVHNAIYNLYDTNKIKKIGVLDENMYLLLKEKFNEIYHIFLDVPKTQKTEYKRNGIAILNSNEDPRHSYYNSLSAIKLINNKANLLKKSVLVKKFVKEFKIENKEFKTLEDLIKNSEIALNINFCNLDDTLFFKCMDLGIPCILGNNTILEKDSNLKEMLQLKSDDDIDEIASKIQDVRKNKEKILEEYSIYREKYSKKSKDSVNKFLSNLLVSSENKQYEKLLTIGIPVYNVEDYVAKCIESVLAFKSDEVEILIVNDGSTDNSEEIILSYQKKYPNLIKYIKQDNNGLGNVRNVILNNAKGKYIASIDSDDVINKKFFHEAWGFLEKNVDMVICDWLSIFGENEKYPTPALDEGISLESNYKKILYSTIMPSACNKIVKKDLYERIGLKFIEGLKFEDLGTNPIILSELETIAYIAKPYYEYTIRNNSIMRTEIEYNMIDVLKLLQERMDKYITKHYNKKEFMAYVFFWRVEESIINQLYKLDTNKRKKMIDYMYENMFPILQQLYCNNEYVSYLINRVDEETVKYILERNERILNKSLEEYLETKIQDKSYKILTPALILYNYDNR